MAHALVDDPVPMHVALTEFSGYEKEKENMNMNVSRENIMGALWGERRRIGVAHGC